jgi:uncharacterized protein (TIGR02145 family)
MTKINPIIQLLFSAGLLILVFTACNKTDDPGGVFPSAGTVNDVDGNVYHTVKIGNQVWTVENLRTTKYNDGTTIPEVTSETEWSNIRTGAYCNYDNQENQAATYGKLYNWHAVNTGKLAPEGWHVPTSDEWTILENYLIANEYNFDGTKEENKIAQSLCAKTDWKSSDDTGTPGAKLKNNNSTGFTALPGGYRFCDGKFLSIKENGVWWSSSDYSASSAIHRTLSSNDVRFSWFGNNMECGFSVRLVQD